MRNILIKFLDEIKAYEHESGHSIHNDDRESSEIVDIHLNSNPELKNHSDKGDVMISSNNSRREKLIDRFSLILGWGKIVMTDKQKKDLNYLIKITEEVYSCNES